MIIGIALVVDDISKGQKLVFRFPFKGQSPASTGSAYPALAAHCAAEFHEIDCDTLAKLFRPKSILCNSTLEMVIDNIRFICHPMEVKHNSDGPLEQDSIQHDMIFFNVVIALTTKPVERIGQLQEQLQLNMRGIDMENGGRYHTHKAEIRSAVANISAAMMHEEKRCKYVSREVSTMLKIREQFQQQFKQGDDTQKLVHDLLDASALAKDLKELQENFVDASVCYKNNICSFQKFEVPPVYLALAKGIGIHIKLNNWISLSFRTIEGTGSTRPWTSYAPYETLLLIEDEAKVLLALPVGSSPQLIRLICASNPLRSFEELSADTEIPLSQVFQLSSHLVFWRHARIIDTIAQSNIYQVSQISDAGINSRSSIAFRLKFPRQRLPQILAHFSDGKSLEGILELFDQQQHLELLQMVVWLLQHELLVHLKEYLVPMLPAQDAAETVKDLAFEEATLDHLNDGSRLYSIFRILYGAATSSFPTPIDLREVIWYEGLDPYEAKEACLAYDRFITISLRPRAT